jgi:hypothetical protein
MQGRRFGFACLSHRRFVASGMFVASALVCIFCAITPKAFRYTGGVCYYAEGGPVFTPKAFANSSPGFERSENPGINNPKCETTLSESVGKKSRPEI